MAIVKRQGQDGKPAWQVRISVRDPKTGKRNNRTLGTYRTKREAEKEERLALTQRDRGSFVDPAKTTVAELLDAWLLTKTGTITENSAKDYEIAIRLHLKPALGQIPVQRLTPDQVQAAHASWRERKMSDRMIHRCHLVLSQALKQAMQWGVVHRNVCEAVAKPKLSRGKPSVWTPEHAAVFLDAASDDGLWPLWPLLVLEGMRRGEALGLRWSDINWHRGTGHISQTVAPNKQAAMRDADGVLISPELKAGELSRVLIQNRTKTSAGARTVRLTVETLAALKEHRKVQNARRLAAAEWHDYDLIVCTSKGTPINPNNVSRSFERVVRIAGVPRIRVHDLRHTAATLLLLSGVPAKIVSERLGHASIAITLDLYSHVLPDMQDQAADAMTALMSKARTGS